MGSFARLLLCFALAALLPACHRDTETSVVGSASFALQPSGTTAFTFAHETTLPNEMTARTGMIGGHCVLGTETETVDAHLEVVGGVSEGVSSLDVHVAMGVATVEASVNGKMYTADCDQLVLASDPTGGTFHVAGSCPLLSTAPDTVTLTADLDFDACRRE